MSNTGVSGTPSQSPDPSVLQAADMNDSYYYNPDLLQDHVRQLSEEGYLVRENVLFGEKLERLRNAVDEVSAKARSSQFLEKSGFGGLFVRNLLDQHETFHELLDFSPNLTLARAVLGNRLQVHAFFMRVACPEMKNQEVAWHFHQRLEMSSNRNPVFQPIVLDYLMYLDDVTFENGPLVVLPGSHLSQSKLGKRDFSDKPGQIPLTPKAGSCVAMQGATWHRALPTLPGSPTRRVLMIAYSPTWMQQADVPASGLSNALRSSENRNIRELLGAGSAR